MATREPLDRAARAHMRAGMNAEVSAPFILASPKVRARFERLLLLAFRHYERRLGEGKGAAHDARKDDLVRELLAAALKLKATATLPGPRQGTADEPEPEPVRSADDPAAQLLQRSEQTLAGGVLTPEVVAPESASQVSALDPD